MVLYTISYFFIRRHVIERLLNNNRSGQLSTVGRYMRLKLVQSFKDGKFPRKALLENGLKTVQGPTKATEQLIAYLEQ